MKKIFLFTSIVLFAFTSNVFSQTPPSSFAATNITQTSADLSWVDNGCATGISLKYRPVGDPLWTQVPVATSPYQLVALFSATNYEWRVKCSNASWSGTTLNQFQTLSTGCTDTLACNYDPLATADDGSCILPDGCTDITACNYDSLATCDDGSCFIIYGCTDTIACNYDSLATCDDGSCFLTYGCTDIVACNYDSLATCDDGSCLNINGCTDIAAYNYNPLSNCDDGSCILAVVGCTNANACNYNPLANQQTLNGACIFPDGCTDSIALNYDSLALCNDGSCIDPILGCIDNLACNFNSLANTDDGSCILPDGCTLPLADNYDPLALCNDGSCLFSVIAISNAVISYPIKCYGDFLNDSLQVNINQSATPTTYKCLVGSYANNTPIPTPGTDFFLSYLSAQQTNATQLNFNGFNPGVNYFVRIVDSVAYYNSHAFGNGSATTGILDQFGPINFAEPDSLVASTSSISSNLCFDDCKAIEQMVISGGTKPYNYTIDSGPNITLLNNESSVILDNLCDSTYTIIVKDFNECSSSPSPLVFTITEPTELVPAGVELLFGSSSYNISCNGAADGQIGNLIATSGGTSPYQYSSNNIFGPYLSVVQDLDAGNQRIYYKDINGCVDSLSFSLFEPDSLILSFASIDNPDCFDSPTGKITVNLTGGAGNEAFSIDPLAVSFPYLTTTIVSLYGDSNYLVTVQDQNLCQDTIQVYMSEPNDIEFLATSVDYNGFGISCNGFSNGEINSFAFGGTGPVEYSIDGTNFQSSGFFSGLSAGSYTVTFKDSLDCIRDTIINILEPGIFDINPIVSSNYSGSDISCFGLNDGEISTNQINGIGSILYEFNNSGTPNFDSLWSSLSSGSYEISAVDENGCQDTVSITILDPQELVASISLISNEYCNYTDGSLEVIFSGGTGLTSFLWNNGQTTAIIDSISAGTFQCLVSDLNGCNVVVLESIINEVPFQLNVSSTSTCLGLSSGTATVNVSPIGTFVLLSPTYLWNDIFSQQTQTATNLSLGTYNVIVSDQGCTTNIDVVIDTSANPVTINDLEVTQISCNDANDGQIIVHATGGVEGYLFSINSSPSTNDSIFNNLAQGSYQIEVVDFSGCTFTETIDVINPDEILVGPITINPVSCFNECDASIQSVQAIGGTPFNTGSPYLYSVNGGLPHPNMSYFINYCADTYTVQVKDVNNCVSSTFLIISEPDILEVDIATSEWNNYQVRCHGQSSGIANISAVGGTAPYLVQDTISFNSSQTIDSLSAGIYNFELVDNNGCVFSQTISYNEPDPITHNFIANHVSCIGWSNASLLDSVYGGVGNSSTYTYSWNTGETSYSLSGIPTGTYAISVTDENNCIITDSFTINDDNALSAFATVTNVSCFDFCDGEILANISGGVPSFDSNGNQIYNYLWNDTLFQTTQTAVGLCVNNTINSTTYECIITDQQGCIVTLSANVTQPSQIEVSASLLSEISCFDGTNGKIDANATGGSIPYEYMWSNNAPNYSTNSNNNNIPSGDYVITVMDNNGCTASDFISINQPTELALSISDFPVTCFSFEDGKIEASASNGTPFLGIPPEYIYTINYENGNTVYSGTNPVGLAENLVPGIYTVTAEDSKGCTIESGTVYISEPGDSLSITFNTVYSSCFQNNGSATVIVNGGTPYNSGGLYDYNWENNIATMNNTNLQSGYYPVTVVDSRGCSIIDSAFVKGTHNVFADSLSELTFNICLGDSIYINVNETPLNTYLWEDGSPTTDRWIFPDNYENIYTLNITDPTCVDPYQVFVNVNVDFIDAMPMSTPGITNGSYPVVLAGEDLTLFSQNNSCVEYSWRWSNDTIYNNNGSHVITDVEKTDWYFLEVKNSEGCLGYDSLYVVVGVKPYDAITPNNDGYNDTWKPLDIESYENALIQIFNRWGGLVFESTGGEDCTSFDGEFEGNELPSGTYYYIIDLNTGDEPQTGPITIIR